MVVVILMISALLKYYLLNTSCRFYTIKNYLNINLSSRILQLFPRLKLKGLIGLLLCFVLLFNSYFLVNIEWKWKVLLLLLKTCWAFNFRRQFSLNLRPAQFEKSHIPKWTELSARKENTYFVPLTYYTIEQTTCYYLYLQTHFSCTCYSMYHSCE